MSSFRLSSAYGCWAPVVRIVAAQALGQFGSDADRSAALELLVESADVADQGVFLSMLALNALDELDDKAASVRADIRRLPSGHDDIPRRMRAYVNNLRTRTLSDLEKPTE